MFVHGLHQQHPSPPIPFFLFLFGLPTCCPTRALSELPCCVAASAARAAARVAYDQLKALHEALRNKAEARAKAAGSAGDAGAEASAGGCQAVAAWVPGRRAAGGCHYCAAGTGGAAELCQWQCQGSSAQSATPYGGGWTGSQFVVPPVPSTVPGVT